MRFHDGSYRCGYNIQVSTEKETELALAVKVSQNGNDKGEISSMYQHLKKTYQINPEEYFADKGFYKHSDIQMLADEGVTLYMPTEIKNSSTRDKVLNGEDADVPEAVKKLVYRMETDEAKEAYNMRIRVSETINAFFRNHGLGQFLVRGMRKAAGVMNLYCLTYNFFIIKRLFPEFLNS